jgi:heptosyltransferase-2
MPSGDFKRILVWLPNWVGDVVMATPTLAALRGHFGSARITLVGRPVALALLKGSAWADETIADAAGGANVLGSISLARRLRPERFDLAVLLPNSFRTAFIARAAGAKRIAGYARDGRGWLLQDKLSPPRDSRGKLTPVPALQYYARLAALLGADCKDMPMSLPLSVADAAAAEEELRRCGADPDRPIVMLNPGAAFGTSKLWAAERYAQLADALIQKHGAQVIVNAAPAERATAAEVVGAMKHKPLLHFADRDNSLGLLKGLLARTDLLVTNDTGARHVGAAMGSAVVTIFGSTDPEWTRLDYPRERLVRVDVSCSPCQKKFCRLPAGLSHHQCMTGITAERVLAAAEELLAGQPEGRRRRIAVATGEGRR